MHQSTTPSLSKTIWPRWASRQFLSLPIVRTLLPVTFGYSLSSEAVVMRQLGRWKRLWRRSLTRSHKRTSMGRSRSCWNGSTSALQPEEITSKGTRVSWVYYQYKCPYEKSLETYLMILVFAKLLCTNWIPHKVSFLAVFLQMFPSSRWVAQPRLKSPVCLSIYRSIYVCVCVWERERGGREREDSTEGLLFKWRLTDLNLQFSFS